ncbi:unnamed protein product [Brachionus calyciflorus]|uniref:Regulator of G-protein signaling 7 n=1 Tax=Brachionus calyciflorus TaxID=104777 RepID=A0A813QRK3_9BILA|nr:unnamed protein product [Brachionus calyciflorus]
MSSSRLTTTTNTINNSVKPAQQLMPKTETIKLTQTKLGSNNFLSQSTSLINTISLPPPVLLNNINPSVSIDETPNKLLYKKIENIIEKMQDDSGVGVPIRTVKSFMSKIPSVFTGTDLIQWMLKKLDVEDTCEALHFAHLISSHGYLFPIDDHILTVKNDGTFFRFQTPYYWPSNNAEPENTDYAVYLCKRTMQNKTRLELADYEAENLAKLQKLLSKKWEFIYMQAEAQIKVDKKRDKMERKILDSQERAFWDVYRPAPGCVNTTEEDIRKTMRMRRTDHPNLGFFRTKAKPSLQLQTPQSPMLPHTSNASIQPTTSSQINQTQFNKLCENDEVTTLENLKKEKDFLKRRLERRYVKVSRVSESYTNYFEQYIEFDPFVTPPDPSNPWITDSTEFWDMEKSLKDIPQRRVRRWGFSIHELLKDPSGRELFRRFLEREFSSENLRFYEVCNELRYATNKDIAAKVEDIYNEFLAPVASCPINIDSRVMAITKTKMENPDRYTYDEAREHIFNLMTRDSYNRFLRSDTYRDSLACAKKKPSKKY